MPPFSTCAPCPQPCAGPSTTPTVGSVLSRPPAALAAPPSSPSNVPPSAYNSLFGTLSVSSTRSGRAPGPAHARRSHRVSTGTMPDLRARPRHARVLEAKLCSRGSVRKSCIRVFTVDQHRSPCAGAQGFGPPSPPTPPHARPSARMELGDRAAGLVADVDQTSTTGGNRTLARPSWRPTLGCKRKGCTVRGALTKGGRAIPPEPDRDSTWTAACTAFWVNSGCRRGRVPAPNKPSA